MKTYIPLAQHYERLDPEDLAQELAIFAWKLRRSGENPRFMGKKLQWFSMDYRRRKQRERELHVPLESVTDTLKGLGLFSRGILAMIAAALSLEEKQVFPLLIQGFSQKEIADEMRISKSEAFRLVKSIRSRAFHYI